MSHPTKITFFEFLTPLITSGQKTITIRDKSESHYVPNTVVDLHKLETDEKVCQIKILAVEELNYNDINEFHAKQEAMDLAKLKSLIKDIYPDTNELFLISFELV